MHNILIIDDDQELCSMLSDYFSPEGFTVETLHDAKTGLESALSSPCELVILDVCLPDRSGFEVLKELREKSHLPVLMLTGRGDSVDRVVGLELGADDYMPKPFVPRELLARVRALLRRTKMTQGGRPHMVSGRLQADDVVLDVGKRAAMLKGEELPLTNVEFTILHLFLQSRGNLVSREDLSQMALGREFTPYDRSIDVHISNLRRKLGPAPDGGRRITTLRGAGYIFNASSCDTNEGLTAMTLGGVHD